MRIKGQGFTLVELLVAVGITIIAAAILFAVFIRSNSFFYLERNKVDQGLSLANSLKTINDLVRISSAIATSYTIGSSTYTSNLSSLVLQLPSIDSNGNNITNTFDYAVISQDLNNSHILRLRTFPNAASTRHSKNQVLSSNLSKVNFFYYDNNGAVVAPGNATKVNVTLNALDQSALSNLPSSASSDINLRNN